jgi:hypothetical protein
MQVMQFVRKATDGWGGDGDDDDASRTSGNSTGEGLDHFLLRLCDGCGSVMMVTCEDEPFWHNCFQSPPS